MPGIVQAPFLLQNNPAHREPLPPHKKLRRYLQSISGFARYKALTGLPGILSEHIHQATAVSGNQGALEEIDVQGTAAKRPYLVNVGQWSRYESAASDQRGLVDEEVQNSVEEWRAAVASSTSSSLVRNSPLILHVIFSFADVRLGDLALVYLDGCSMLTRVMTCLSVDL